MNKQELIKSLIDLHKGIDTENAHVYADRLIIEFINDKDIEDAYNKVPKWYS